MPRPIASDESELTALSRTMAGHIDRGSVPGLVIGLTRGDARWVAAFGAMGAEGACPMERNTIFRLASLTKPVAGLTAMMLMEDGVFRLDDPIENALPELTDRRVLRHVDGPLDDTIPAERPILVEDLLTCRAGLGLVMTPGRSPISERLSELGIAPGPNRPVDHTPETWLAAAASLPLIDQPGTVWRYDTSITLLGFFLERVSGKSLDTLFRDRVFAPLGMNDTGFHIPPEKQHRLPPCYSYETGAPRVVEPAGRKSLYATPPSFRSAAAGLLSTADDYLAFAQMMANRGMWNERRIVSERAIDAMSQDRIATAQKKKSPFFPGFWDKNGWGYGTGIATGTGPDDPRGIGWVGGTGTCCYWNPNTGHAAILLTQRMLDSPDPPTIFADFWRHANNLIS